MTIATEPSRFVGSVKTLSEFGPAYQVIGLSRNLDDGDILMNIEIIESREIAEYRLSCIKQDPKAK